MSTRKIRIMALVGVLVLLFTPGQGLASSAGTLQNVNGQAQDAPTLLGPGFTYQGQLKDSAGSSLTATCNFKFSLWDGPYFPPVHPGNQVGSENPVEGVSVVNGYFTAVVNAGGEFGASAFNGEDRWLQIFVQCGSDPDYTKLSPRQHLTPAPYASYALAAGSVPWNGLDDVPAGFADAIDNDTTYVAGNGLTLTGPVFSLNFAGNGSANTAARSDHNHWGAAWSGAGYGLSLTSSNNIGLTASGPLYGVYGQSSWASGFGGFFYNTSGGVGLHAESASGSPLEAYAGGSLKFYVDGLGNAYASGGAPLLPRALAPAANSLTTLDANGYAGYSPSITVGADGLGLISYFDQTNGDLKVAHCSNAACSAWSTATLDSSGDVGWYSSITIGPDGLGLISYYNNTLSDLKTAHCSNTACSSATTSTLDSIGYVGLYSSITIGADGLRLISYSDYSNTMLKVVHCQNAACSSILITSLDTGGGSSSITLGADGLGLISYYDPTNGDLKAAHCSNPACSAATYSLVDVFHDVGGYSSIALGVDGLGLIGYYDNTNGDLKVAHCANTACSAATLAIVDSPGDVGGGLSLTIGPDGLGLISYYDNILGDLKLAHCSNTVCSSATTSTLDSIGYVGMYSSITIGADGLGLIAYLDGTNYDLKVAHCTNAFCVPYLRRR